MVPGDSAPQSRPPGTGMLVLSSQKKSGDSPSGEPAARAGLGGSFEIKVSSARRLCSAEPAAGDEIGGFLSLRAWLHPRRSAFLGLLDNVGKHTE